MKQEAKARSASASTKRLRRRCRQAVMKLHSCRPISPEERRKELAFGFALMTLWILVPIVTIPWLAVLERDRLLIGVLLSTYALSALLAVLRRCSILRKFYRVKQAESLLQVENGREKAKTLCEEAFTMLFPMPPEPPVLKLIGTWLVHRGLVQEGEKLPIYQMKGGDAAPYLSVHVEEDAELLLLPLGERKPDDWPRLRRELWALGGELTAGIAGKSMPAGGEAAKRVEETADYATLWPNKETVDLYVNGQAVRAQAGSGSSYCLADPEGMTWLLPEEWAGRKLTEQERQGFIERAEAAGRGKDFPTVFLTEDRVSAAYALAEKVRDRKLSYRKAMRSMQEQFPALPAAFYSDLMNQAMKDTR